MPALSEALKTGESIYLIDTERFVALLLKDLAPNADKIAEFAIKQALHRYGEMSGISKELEKFFSSKATLEVMKSDLRSNIAHTINNSSEAAIREAVRPLREGNRVELPTG